MILVCLMYALFASTFVIGKLALLYISPLLFIGIRMLIGGSILLLYYRFIAKNKLTINKKDYNDFGKIIFFHIFCAYTLEFFALEYIQTAKACLAYNLSPFFTAYFSYYLFSEKLTKQQFAGLLIGFIGFLPMLLTSSYTTNFCTIKSCCISIYDIALLISVASSAYGWIIMKKLIDKKYSFLLINSIGMIGGGIIAFLLSLAYEGAPQLKNAPTVCPLLAHCYGPTTEKLIMLSIYSLSLIVIANIICYNLYAYLLSRYSPTLLSFAGFLTPLFAALFGWVFLQEALTCKFFITIIIVFIGLYIFSLKKQ